MAEIVIQLSDELQSFVDDEVEAGGYASASDYLVALLTRLKQQAENEGAPPADESVSLDDDTAALDDDLWNNIRTDVDGHTGI